MPAAYTSTKRPKALALLKRRGRGLQSSVPAGISWPPRSAA